MKSILKSLNLASIKSGQSTTRDGRDGMTASCTQLVLVVQLRRQLFARVIFTSVLSTRRCENAISRNLSSLSFTIAHLRSRCRVTVGKRKVQESKRASCSYDVQTGVQYEIRAKKGDHLGVCMYVCKACRGPVKLQRMTGEIPVPGQGDMNLDGVELVALKARGAEKRKTGKMPEKTE